jgi:Ni,Fe-hydrogenase III large subunit
MNQSDLIRGSPTEPVQPWPRHVLSADAWAALVSDTTLELQAMWADTTRVHALLRDATGAILPVCTAVTEGRYAALSPLRPSATWFERMIHDLFGHIAEAGRDRRPWLDHGKWPSAPPMALRPQPVLGATEPPEFLPAGGTGLGEDLHQVAVGPIHAGIIEPGHFRITAQGETVVRLEVRLGYTHKGTLVLMRGKPPRAAARYAARLSGDSSVGHSIAYARAVEAATEIEVPARAHALRAVMAELERIANHLGDVGGICRDAAFGFLPARCGWHREAILQACMTAFGHRLMMDSVVPGGLAADIAPGGSAALLRAVDAVQHELPALIQVYDSHSSLIDRMVGTGILSCELAALHGAGGVVGRASGRDVDARRSPGYPPYDRLPVTVPVLREGDVDARVRIRFAELAESVRLIRVLLRTLPDGALSVPLPMSSGEGIGVAEGFRGDIWHFVSLDGGLVASCFARDPSWLQWPLLEAAIEGNIIADFPLCNKSFNCSYSGVDL